MGNEELLVKILDAIADLKESMNSRFDKLEKRMDDIEADIAVLVQESHANKKAIYQLKNTNAG